MIVILKKNRKENPSAEIDNTHQKMFYDTKVNLLAESETNKIIQLQNETGDGLMSCYTVFPGIYIMFNDFHMDHCESNFETTMDMFCINHCREGRIEQEIVNGAYVYLCAKDCFIDCRKSGGRNVEFPSGHYHGLTIIFDLKEANDGISSFIRDFPVDISNLCNKYCHKQNNLILQNDSGLERLFFDLYFVPLQIKIPYFRAKIQVLLLYLDALEISSSKTERPYFYKTQVEKAKAIHALMAENLDVRYTIEELSQRFDFPMTAMKLCFKNIYGDSIDSYMRSYRMDRAAFLLRNHREKSVLEIASLVGYDSPGKFSTAFKKIMGVSPLTYRKNCPMG